MSRNKLILLWEIKKETQHTAQIRDLLALYARLAVHQKSDCTDCSSLNKKYVPEINGAKLVHLGEDFYRIC